jgi:hypothetical protein
MLNIRVTQIQLHQLVVEVNDDLQGNGDCRFSSIPAAGLTRVEFDWNVQTSKPWDELVHHSNPPGFHLESCTGDEAWGARFDSIRQLKAYR